MRQQPIQNKYANINIPQRPEEQTSYGSNVSGSNDSGVRQNNLEYIEDDDGNKVIASAKGTFGHSGGTLKSVETGVSLTIPVGAIPYGSQQEIYWKGWKKVEFLVRQVQVLGAKNSTTKFQPLFLFQSLP